MLTIPVDGENIDKIISIAEQNSMISSTLRKAIPIVVFWKIFL